jgi:hypothetical protein
MDCYYWELCIGLAVAGACFAKQERNKVRGGTIRIGNQSEAEFSALIKITMEQAVQKTLGAVSGQVLKVQLEDENGFMVYGVEVVVPPQPILRSPESISGGYRTYRIEGSKKHYKI